MPLDKMLEKFNGRPFKVFDNTKNEDLTAKGEKVLDELIEFLKDVSETWQGIEFNPDEFEFDIRQVIKQGY